MFVLLYSIKIGARAIRNVLCVVRLYDKKFEKNVDIKHRHTKFNMDA